MAQMIPEYMPDHATDGEKAIFARLQKLPEDVLVFYEPIVKRRYPDFVVIHPRLGVLVIEVKGWRAGWLEAVTPDEVKYRMAGQERTDWHPLKQARQYQNRLMSLCQAHPYGPDFLMKDGRFSIAFGSLAVLTGITRAEMTESRWSGLFPATTIVCSDEWARLKDADGAEFDRMLGNAFDPEIPRRRLSDVQVNLIRDIIHPSPFPPQADAPNSVGVEDLKRLDFAQERIARDMRQGHRVIYGVAGSGKTVVLEWRAKILSEDADRRILVLCYNVALAEYLADRLSDKANVEVASFGRWAMKQGAEHTYDSEVFGESLLSRLDRGLGCSGAYDSILIDEGQDFANSWIRCAVAALRDPVHSDLLIAYDLSQNLYNRPPINWSKVGVSIVGGAGGSRTQRLAVNYRNTFEIVSAARSFADAVSRGDAEVIQVDPQSCLRRGPWPIAARSSSREALIAHCSKTLSDLVTKGIEVEGRKVSASPDEIRVIYPRAEANLVDRLKSTLLEQGLGAVSVGTIHGSKGLQARVVAFVFADQLPSQFKDRDEAAERALFYVALTRPEELLFVFYSHDTPYVSEFVKNLDAFRTA